jgi:HAE1 family hydrophobic/amphiphilic exporter-1
MYRRLVVLVAIGVSGLFAQNQEPQQQPQQTPEMRSFPDPAAPARVGVGITQRQLSLEEAVQMALSNNLDIEIERTNRSTAETNVQAARGFFDPSFRWTPLLETRNTPVGSVLQGEGGRLTDKGFVNNFYIRQRLPN